MAKLAIISSHPIQYNAPLFKLLQQRNFITIKIFYTWSQSQGGNIYDPGFGKKIEWDIPLLKGYDYTFVTNTSQKPGTHHFNGIINPTLNTEIEQWGAEAVLVYGWAFKSHLNCLRHFHNKIPILFRGDSTLMGENFGIKMIVRTLYLKWVYKHIDYALYVGTNNKKYYLRHGIKEQQLYFAPHAIDNDRFSANKAVFKSEAAAWRKDLGIAEDGIVFLFAGKLEINKNAQLLIKSYKKISHNNNIHLVIVGNGVMEQRLKKKYFYLSNLHFTDFQNQSNMPVVYNLGDVFVLPSKGPVETWGLAINEAMACSKAIIASNRCGGAIDLVRNNVNGFIFKNNDEKDLAKKMEQIIISRDSMIKMGERSEEIIKDWNFENICKPIEKLLNDYLKAKKKK